MSRLLYTPAAIPRDDVQTTSKIDNPRLSGWSGGDRHPAQCSGAEQAPSSPVINDYFWLCAGSSSVFL